MYKGVLKREKKEAKFRVDKINVVSDIRKEKHRNNSDARVHKMFVIFFEGNEVKGKYGQIY